MSWDCETCGHGIDKDHALCRVANNLYDISVLLERIAVALEKKE